MKTFIPKDFRVRGGIFEIKYKGRWVKQYEVVKLQDLTGQPEPETIPPPTRKWYVCDTCKHNFGETFPEYCPECNARLCWF